MIELCQVPPAFRFLTLLNIFLFLFAGIVVKSVANTISYQQATANCQFDGKELCSAKEICSDGKTPYQGVIPGDHWVPARDSTNEWIQIGELNISKSLEEQIAGVLCT